MPSFNEHTGARISSGSHVKGTDKEKWDSNWDGIFGKKPNTKTIAAMEELDRGNVEKFESVEALMKDLAKDTHLECESCCGRGWVETWEPEGEGAEDCGECAVLKRGWFMYNPDFECRINVDK